jgi:hypothetical protein
VKRFEQDWTSSCAEAITVHSLILRVYTWLKRRSTIVIGYGSAELKGRSEGYPDIGCRFD